VISTNIKNQLFGILNFGHCDLPFGLAQGGESFDSAQDRELVEPFGICVLLFEIFLIAETEHQNLTPSVPYNMLSEKPQ